MEVQQFYEHNIAEHLCMTTTILPFKKNDFQKYSTLDKRYLVTLKYHDHEAVFNHYSQTEPTPYDVFLDVYVLTTCVYNINFMQFCEKFAFDSDSIKIRNKFKECRKICKKLQNLIGVTMFEELMLCSQ